MVAVDGAQAARELDRLDDLGRGSVNREAWQWRRRDRWLLIAAAWVVAAPQGIVLVMGGPWSPSGYGMLIGALIPAGYVVVTGMLAPTGLPDQRRRLWLSSKIAGATMMSLVVGVLAIAGAFGFVIALPVSFAAAICAVGTAMLRSGLIVGAVPSVAVLAFLGHACLPYHFSIPADTVAAHAVAYGAYAAAGVIAILALGAQLTTKRGKSSWMTVE